jgi:hypothetical protein
MWLDRFATMTMTSAAISTIRSKPRQGACACLNG